MFIQTFKNTKIGKFWTPLSTLHIINSVKLNYAQKEVSDKDMADTQVNFVRCSQATYDELEKDDNTIYFILDKGKIYQGLVLVGETGGSLTWEEYVEDGSNTAKLGEAVLSRLKLGTE